MCVYTSLQGLLDVPPATQHPASITGRGTVEAGGGTGSGTGSSFTFRLGDCFIAWQCFALALLLLASQMRAHYLECKFQVAVKSLTADYLKPPSTPPDPLMVLEAPAPPSESSQACQLYLRSTDQQQNAQMALPPDKNIGSWRARSRTSKAR